MPSRRRSRSKNLGTNLADVQRRMRYLERRPVRTKLQRKIVTAVNIAPETITPDEVNFGTVVTTPETDTNNVDIQNPKDGLLVVSTTNGSSSVYSAEEDQYYLLADPVAQTAADQAADDAAQAALDAAQAASDAADAAAAAAAAEGTAQQAELSANKKNTVFRQSTTPTANSVGDVWFDTTPVTKDGYTDYSGARPKRWTGSVWEEFGLNYAAITSIDAGTINAGELIGRTVKTSASGNRVEMSNTDEITFYGTNGNNIVGKIGPDVFGTSGLDISGGISPSNSPLISLRGDYSGDSSVSITLPSGESSVLIYDNQSVGFGSGGVIINGGGSTGSGGLALTSGAGGFSLVDWSGSAYGSTIYAYQDQLSIGSGEVSINASTAVILSGDLVLGYGTYQQGSGAPSGTPAGGTGTVVFRYT